MRELLPLEARSRKHAFPAQVECLLNLGPTPACSEDLVEEIVIPGSKHEVRGSLGSSSDWALFPECRPHQRAFLGSFHALPFQ